MFPNPEFPTQSSASPWRPGLAVAAASLLLAACGALPWFSGKSGNSNNGAGQKISQPAATAAAQAASSPASSPAAPPPAPPPAPDAVARMLTYAERVRVMQPAELTQESARLSAPGEATLPASQLQLSLVLSQLRQLPELIRAQELLARVLANAGPDAQPLHPLARLLAFRYGEQRRLEDQIEKERQQTREVQRKLDQTNERLEALKAIERSLTARPPAPPVPAPAQPPVSAPAPAPASAPASRGKPSTP
jgi:hypothetical protein